MILASGCNCVDPIKDKCDGKHECNGGCNLYAFGYNKFGQSNGIPSDSALLVPQIVPYFVYKKIKIEKIAAIRSRSVAISTENDVYEWGFVDVDEGYQFKKLFTLPGECKDV